MACFLVSAAGAVAVSAASKAVKHNESVKEAKETHAAQVAAAVDASETKGPFSRKLSWLAYLLWGGAFLLMFEHVWHGEVVPWFPFLTNASNPADAAEMLHEMSTVGVCMALLIVAVWAGILVAVHFIEKRGSSELSKERI